MSSEIRPTVNFEVKSKIFNTMNLVLLLDGRSLAMINFSSLSVDLEKCNLGMQQTQSLGIWELRFGFGT
jgi:hypothetical protein